MKREEKWEMLRAISCVIHFNFNLIWPLQFLEYLRYFLMGNYLRKNGRKLWGHAGLWLLLSGICLFVIFLLNEYQFYYGIYDSTYFRNPNFPTIIVASLAIFVAFSKVEIDHISSHLLEIAKHSMVIYMLHPLIINIVSKVTKVIGGGKKSAHATSQCPANIYCVSSCDLYCGSCC